MVANGNQMQQILKHLPMDVIFSVPKHSSSLWLSHPYFYALKKLAGHLGLLVPEECWARVGA